MLLIDDRTHVPHAFLGFLLGVDDSTVCRTHRRIEPLLAGVFRVPERTVELSQDEFRELSFDATERPHSKIPTHYCAVILINTYLNLKFFCGGSLLMIQIQINLYISVLM